MYECKITFIISDDVSDIYYKLCKKYKFENIGTGNLAGAVVSNEINNYNLLLDIKHLDFNTISHEIYHLTCKIGSDRGIIEEESRAWICGHITENLYKFLKKNNLH